MEDTSQTPTYGTVAAELAGNLLAIGSSEESDALEIYMHVVSTDSWAYVSTLPSHKHNFAVANLSPLEILVIAGNSVHKGSYTHAFQMTSFFMFSGFSMTL